MTEKLSALEAERYDRQIRLWGIESQEKLRAANVLLIGIRGLGSEIAKNILLAGINSLTILDDGVVTEQELSKNFLLQQNSLGKKIAEEVLPMAQALNPLVKITSDTSGPASKDEKFFKKFTIIVATNIKTDLLLKIAKICRANLIKLIYGDVVGLFGFSVSDLQDHEYHEEQVQLVKGAKRSHDGAEKTMQKVHNTLHYRDLNKVLILPNTKQNVGAIKTTKRTNKLFFLMLALMEFRNRYDRNPLYDSKEEDIKTLQIIKDEIYKLYEVKETRSKLPEEVFSLIFDEVGAVCAVLGGVVAQEVIKAVSHKEVPINNVFLFDPITFSGQEETI